jgi:signal transduction histidine kinase
MVPMDRDTWVLIAIAAGSAATVGTISLVLAYTLRRCSLRWDFALVALSAVLAMVAGFVGTARAMFLSAHDFVVVVRVSGIAGFVSLGFALLAARFAVRSSAQLQEATRSMGSTGIFVTPEAAPSELTAIAHQLSDTSQRLSDARQRERNLESSRRELVAWVSHDLRTPLAGLRAMAEALEDGIAVDPARYHTQIRLTVDRMTRMVDDLFELSRIHAESLQLAIEPVPLADAIGEVIAVSAPVAWARGVRLGGYAEPGAVVRADPKELSRMIQNLVTNAIRHTPSEGIVEVTGRVCNQVVELSVSDACGGIPQEDLARVFDVAWRGNHARTPDNDAGSGLGLAIVRGIASAHRGTVRVENVGPGCRFLVELPA